MAVLWNVPARLARNRGVDPEASKFQPSYFTSSSGEKLLRLRGGAELSAEKLAEKSAAERSEAAANQKKYADAVERDLESTVSVLAAAGGMAWFTFVTFPGWLKPDLKPSIVRFDPWTNLKCVAKLVVWFISIPKSFNAVGNNFRLASWIIGIFNPIATFFYKNIRCAIQIGVGALQVVNLAVTQIYVVAKTGTWLLPIEWVQIVGKVLGAWGALTNGADFTSTATAFVLCELGYEAKIIKNTDAMQKSKGKKGNLIEQGGIDQTPV